MSKKKEYEAQIKDWAENPKTKSLFRQAYENLTKQDTITLYVMRVLIWKVLRERKKNKNESDLSGEL